MIRSSFFFLLVLLLSAKFSLIAQTSKIDSLKAVLQSLPEDTNRVNTLIALSGEEFYFNLENYAQLANEALVLAEKIHYEDGKVRAYKELGFFYYHTGNFTKAVDIYLKALLISEESKDSTQIASSYNSLGVLYLDQKENEEARNYFTKALAIYERMDDKPGRSMMASNIAETYEKRGNDSLALIHYKQALNFCGEGCNKTILCNIFNRIGEIYLREGAYSEALSYQEKALHLALVSKYPAWIQIVYGSLSKVYAARNLPHKALAAADSAMKYAVQIKSKRFIANSYGYLQKAYEKLNDYQKAYQYQSLHAALIDSLKNLDNLNAVEKMRREYELEKKDLEMDFLTHQYEAGIFRRNTFIGTLVGILALVVFIYGRYRANTKKELAAKKEQLRHYTQSLLEKSEIINNINDELGKLKSNSSASDEDIEKFNQILNLNIHTEENWEKFKTLFEEVHPDFFARLRFHYPDITPSELRLSAIVKLNLSLKDAAIMLGISPASVKQGRYRLRKKFDLQEGETLEEFISRN